MAPRSELVEYLRIYDSYGDVYREQARELLTQLELLLIHRRNMAIYLKQAGFSGGFTLASPSTQNGIRMARDEIKQVKDRYKTLSRHYQSIFPTLEDEIDAIPEDTPPIDGNNNL